jgi:galactokinase
VACLKKNDLPGFGRLLDESQESSRLNFENSIPALDKLCKASQKSPGYLGARLSGGGLAVPPFIWLKLIKKISLASALKS